MTATKLDPRIVKEYLAIQAAGGPSAYFPERHAESALEQARTVVRFRELEAEDRVRLRAEPDEHYQWNECDPKESEKWGDDGAWDSIAEVRLDPDSDPEDDDSWEEVDSCWGHIGYRDVLDPRENCYIVDHMRSAVQRVESHDEQQASNAKPPHGAD